MARIEETRTATRPVDGAGPTAAPARAVHTGTMDDGPGGGRWDRARWGPIWAGAIVALTTFVVLQLLLFALGWLDLGYDGPNSAMATAVISGVLAVVAFFIGGLTTGAGVPWRGSRSDGIFNGVLTWGLTVALILVITLVGGGALAGSLGQVLTGPTPQAVNPAQVIDTARQMAGWTALFLGLTVGAAAMGAGVGSKESIWPSGKATSAS